MNPWQYSFKAISKSEWVRQIERDLKGRPLAALEDEWWSGEPLTPFLHAEDNEEGIICLPEYLFRHPPVIVEWIDPVNSGAQDINRSILQALSFGAEKLLFNLSDKTSLDTEIWLKDVFTEMIGLECVIQAADIINIDRISGQFGQNLLLRIARSDDSPGIVSELIKSERMKGLSSTTITVKRSKS